MYITASKLYNYTQCPHRIWRDEHGPQNEKSKEINPFVQLLWDRGTLYEKENIAEIGEFLDLSKGDIEERFRKTIEALNEGVSLIYQGVLKYDDMLGIPDLLRLESDGSVIPIDIKSGMGYAGTVDEDGGGKLKKHYAVQVALYADLLKRLGFKNNRKGIILDVGGNEVIYDLNEPMGVRTPMIWWEFYERTKESVKVLLDNQYQNKPASTSACKLCPWYHSCKKWIEEKDDLTGLFYVGRSVRDVLEEELNVNRIEDVLSLDTTEIIERKKKDKEYLKGIGESTLTKVIRRANILKNTKEPVTYKKITFPVAEYELFFDIEADPTREFVYIHGIYERSSQGEKYLDFTARDITPEAEKEAWIMFWDYIRSLPSDNYAVYYYSKYERTAYRALQKKYPDVVTSEEVENFFNPEKAIDLYTDVVLKHTDWPLGSYSIKELAVHLGFKWEDTTPSGALSIEWFNRFIESKDEKVMERILVYNKDDCVATMMLKDGLQKLFDGS